MSLVPELVRERVLNISENPHIKALSLVLTLVLSFILMPYLYWVSSSMIAVLTRLNTVEAMQQQQQTEMAVFATTQGRLLENLAVEAQARATEDAQFNALLTSLQQKTQEIDRHLDNTDSRINTLYLGYKRQ